MAFGKLLNNKMLTTSASIVISTRGRGDSICATLDSLVPECDQRNEIIIVDSSDENTTQDAVQGYLTSHNVRYFRVPHRGLSFSRNYGIGQAASEFIALTDDDCMATPGWVSAITQPLQQDPRIAVVFGNLLPVEHDETTGFVMSYRREGEYTASSLLHKHRVEGVGACMALRKKVWLELGGFDPFLGAGAMFHSAEELDLVLRVLQAAYLVHETDKAVVMHAGFRLNTDKDKIAGRYAYGIAAAYTKHLRCGRFSVLLALAALGARWAFRAPVVGYGNPPSKASRLSGFAGGLAAAIRIPVDRKKAIFRS